MKKTSTGLVIALAVFTGSAYAPISMNHVEAAAIQQSSFVQKEKVLVNGQFREVNYIHWNKEKLYSSVDIAKMMGAKITTNQKNKSAVIEKTIGKQKVKVSLKADTNTAINNGKTIKLGASSKLVGKSLFVDAKPIIQLLGGDSIVDKNLLISTNGSIKFETGALNVEGKQQKVPVLKVNGKLLYSVQYIAKLFSASTSMSKDQQILIKKNGKTIQLKLSQSSAILKGKTVKLRSFPIILKNQAYADIYDLVLVLGGDVIPVQNGLFVSISGLISGETFNPVWIDKSTLLVSNETETGALSYLVDVNSKKAIAKINGTDLSVSPDGKQAIYSDETGVVYIVDLVTHKVKKINDQDDSPKFEFVWAPDGEKVYFIQGDKSDKISSLNVRDGTITEVYKDGLAYKNDLHLSFDGTKILYAVGKEGKTEFTDDNSDVKDIDVKDTEVQLFELNLKQKEIKPEQLTATAENKVFPAYLENGNVVYVAYDVEGHKSPVLTMIDTARKTTSLLSNKEIIASTVTAQGKIMLLVAETDGNYVLYEMDPDSKKLTKLAHTKMELQSISVSKDGKLIAVTAPGQEGTKVFIIKNGYFEAVTK
ncbi:hypothetical protein C0971_03890 [Bacillus methanolicus]|uniref:stalk domain-containing protein n=1 Tax=Bacillus methanolicus TaxID=1471 RepID=UPI00200C1002|nr:stalk domain-containing protein [Bacillus methanolicus]UQD51250.1 hypothetical protein C0971_03890 [Bacillus methanolicus]